MLTADLAQSWHRGTKTGPRYIDARDSQYLQDAADLIAIFAAHEGRRRAELSEALDAHVGLGVDYRILRGLIKLLTDRCDFETASAVEPVEIRRALFLAAGRNHPVIGDDAKRELIIRETALELECPPQALLEGLYADLPENQKLNYFEPLTEEQLLDLYNLAQAQALLYRCVEMRLWIEPQAADYYRELFGAIKAYRLIHQIGEAHATATRFGSTGPFRCSIARKSTAYKWPSFCPRYCFAADGACAPRLASGSPAARAAARISSLTANSSNCVRTIKAPPLGWKTLAGEKLAATWERLQSLWEMDVSSEVIDLGESAFIPDFVFRHSDGREVYLEVLGFWTPRYLQERLKEFEHGPVKNYLLAAWDELRGSREPLARVPPHTIIFKRNLDAASVEAAINKLFEQV
ncbi:MAG: DUF790 family protein [Pyrinomonadaceae bacterium]